MAATTGKEGKNLMFFPAFMLTTVNVADVSFRLRAGGNGPALLFLHGRSETHAMWHAVAPALASDYKIVCPDLHPAHRMEKQVEDLLALMTNLGVQEFAVAGQDYGAHLACQIVLRAPQRVKALMLLEALPGPDHTGRDDMAFSLAQYESCWFGQLHPKPESRAIAAPPEWRTQEDMARSVFAPEAVADYLASPIWKHPLPTSWPASHVPITCPILTLWGKSGRIGGWYDPLDMWKKATSSHVEGQAIDATHFLPEEAPVEVIVAFRRFLSRYFPA